MQKVGVFLLALVLLFSATTVSCSREETQIRQTVDGNVATYYELEDGRWMCDGRIYQYRLEIRGKLGDPPVDTLFVYLSNLPEISFGRAWKAAGLSSNTEDYFSLHEAVLVEWN